MKSMKDMKFKTRRNAVFFLDFMIFMPFMVKCFVTIHHNIDMCSSGPGIRQTGRKNSLQGSVNQNLHSDLSARIFSIAFFEPGSVFNGFD